MGSAVTFEKYSFSIDLAGEEIEALGYDLGQLKDVESPLRGLEDVWTDAAIRARYPHAMDRVGEMEVSVILGRLTSLFGVVTLDEGEIEGTAFRAPLVITEAGGEDSEALGVAVLYDSVGTVYLSVISFDAQEASAEAMAREIWELTLSDLDDLEEEEVRVFDADEGAWLCYGISEGEPFQYYEEVEEEELAEFEEEPYGQERYDEDEEEEY